MLTGLSTRIGAGLAALALLAGCGDGSTTQVVRGADDVQAPWNAPEPGPVSTGISRSTPQQLADLLTGAVHREMKTRPTLDPGEFLLSLLQVSEFLARPERGEG